MCYNIYRRGSVDRYGGGTDCKSVALRGQLGSIPSTPTKNGKGVLRCIGNRTKCQVRNHVSYDTWSTKRVNT